MRQFRQALDQGGAGESGLRFARIRIRFRRRSRDLRLVAGCPCRRLWRWRANLRLVADSAVSALAGNSLGGLASRQCVPGRCAPCDPGQWMSAAASRPPGASRMRKRSPNSLPECEMQMQDLPYNLPDARGHFGPYGGIFVAETLMPALAELREAYAAAQADPAFRAEFEYELKHYVGRPSPIYHAKRWSEPARRRADLPEARGPQPHRRAQDQQLHRPGPAGAAHGQAARDRRNRRRAARRGHGHGGGALRHGMRGLHGLRGHQAPGRQRLSHEAAGGEGGAGRIRLEDAQGRAERGHARLGDQHRQYLLHHRHRGRPASLSDDGARFPGGDRRGVHDADAGTRRTPARCGDRLRRRRLQCDGHFLSLYPARRRSTDRRRSGRRRPRHRASMPLR